MVDEEYQFSKHGLIEKNIEEYRDYSINENDDQFIVLVVGNTGTSKTSLSLLLEHYVSRGDVDLDTYDLTHDEFISDYTSKPKEKFIVHEEGRDSFDKNKYNHTEVAEARDKINQFRKFHHTVFINFQNPNHLTREIVRNGHCLLRTPEKGIVHFYNRNKLRSMWDGNSFRGWKDYNFRDFFPNPADYVPELWKGYEQMVDENLEEKGEGSSSEEDEEEFLEKQYKISEAAEILSLHPETLRKKCRNDEIEYNKVTDKFRLPESVVEGLIS